MNEVPFRFVEPQTVCSQFHLREGDAVADFGAGSGFFLRPLSDAVGKDGVVYALEIQKNLVETMTEQTRVQNITNARVIWADLEAPNGSTLVDDALDAAIMVNTFFQIEDKSATLAEVLRTLRSGGKFFLIDWSESFNNLGPTPDVVVNAADARAAVETAGFVFERDFPAGEHHYGLAFRAA